MKRRLLLSLVFALCATTALAADPPKRPALLDAKPMTVEADATPLRKLQIERYNAALEELRLLSRRRESELNLAGFFEQLVGCHKRLTTAALDLYDKPAERLTWLENLVELHKDLEAVVKLRRDVDVNGPSNHARARHDRADAEIMLLREKAKK